MIFSTLGRYFFTRYVITVCWFFAGIVGIIFLIDLSENSGRFSSLPGFSYTSALFLTLMRLPQFLQQTVPFITLFSGMATMIALNRKYELVVTRAAGISVWQFMSPFLAGALLTGILAVTVLNPLSAYSSSAALTLESSLRGTQNTSFSSVPWLHDIGKDQDIILGAKGVDATGTQLIEAVFFHFDSQGNITLRQDAATASLKDGYWQLNDVMETVPGEPVRNLKTAQVRTSLKREFLQERLSSAETIGFFEIPERIAAARAYGISTRALETQFHSLLSLPFLLIAMTLIAGTVSLKFSRFSQSKFMIFGGIMTGFMLYVVTVLVRVFGSSGAVPPFVATWTPVVIALSAGATILLHQEDG
ncbi:LPS export ABC transporter permease LptG [Rhizobium sp. L1K21]|uniref:LPS export ABC transporter permease LptG n=1 Tax=Rhizobium sp. L1K21 TaxID=2954933 RepID=UPI0020931DDB|nr:LPS export ABC transporter permease LptG [Rhizobium sp. L1K21]MCO6186516.1 LPS export ABC transporter permease LptG [Rhizobium sp. L1K21]